MKLSNFILPALASIGTMVTANPVPDNQVAGLGNDGSWTGPVGYVCCKTIDKDGCHGCDFNKACPKDDISKCPTGGFCCGFPASAYPIETPTATSTRKNSDALQTSDNSGTTAAGTNHPRQFTYRSAEEATAANTGNIGIPIMRQWCSRDGDCEDFIVGQGCANPGNCGGNACCKIWTWG